jgi:hypothetical protein
MSQTDKLLTEISEKMDKMLRLLAIGTVKGIEKEQDKIELLDSLGFRPVEIAKLLNKSQDNINVQLSKIKKKKEPEAKPKATEPAQAAESHGKNTTGVGASKLSEQTGDQK